MKSAVFVVPGSIAARTGGSIYDRRMVDGLRRRGWDITVVELAGDFPQPSAEAVTGAAAALAALPDAALVVMDGLALSALPEVIEREAARLRIVALVHLPLAADVSIDAETRDRLAVAEQRALAASALIVVTGAATLGLLEPYALPRDRVVVVEPGTDPAPQAKGSDGARVHLLCVATVNAGKGHDVLFEALAAVPNRAWRLTCAGSLTRDHATVDRVRSLVWQLGLDDRVTLAGELDAEALVTCYDSADVFVLATRRETYGMAVAEALARGLPVVSTTTGAIPDLVGADAGVVVPPGEVAPLAEALSRVIGDADLRARMAAGAREVRDRLPVWEVAAARMDAALQKLNSHV
ncbi:MAG: glycosyltransferase family 4 protein [Acidobacteriota bacterium]|nr:glycosyltransferase family 4 protein [Acidobacteriota bacterium]